MSTPRESFTLTFTPAEMGWLVAAARFYRNRKAKTDAQLRAKHGSQFDAGPSEQRAEVAASVERKIRAAGWAA